jgi:hypothetical protein
MLIYMKNIMINIQRRKNHNSKLRKYIRKYLTIIISITFLLSCGGKAMIGSKENLFDIVEGLSEQRPFNKDSIENYTGQSLENIKSESNEFFSFYKSYKSNYQNNNFSIELRVPTSKSSCIDGILILDLSIGTCITQEDVVNKYGIGEPWPPDPNMPDEIALFYLSYNYNWGQISYGFTVIDQECLSSIVLDAIQK